MAEAGAKGAGTRARAGTAALAGTAVGDAVGAPLEGGPPRPLAKARQQVERVLARPPCPYTDDTQMALLLLEHLAATGGDVDRAAYVALLAERVEPWRGYGGGMQMLVARWRAGSGWREAATSVFPDGSFGNGAAMRVAPVGAVRADDLDAVTRLARRQAEPTHAHPVGIDGAVVQAGAAALAAHRGRFGPGELEAVAELAETEELATSLREAATFDGVAVAESAESAPAGAGGGLDDPTLPAVVDRLGAEVLAHRSVPLALWIAAHTSHVTDAVVMAVAAGGDVDTIGAMSAAVRAAAEAAAADAADRSDTDGGFGTNGGSGGGEVVPADWVDAVEDGPVLVARAGELAAAIVG